MQIENLKKVKHAVVSTSLRTRLTPTPRLRRTGRRARQDERLKLENFLKKEKMEFFQGHNLSNKDISIYFGDKNDPAEFGELSKRLNAKSLTVLQQVHGTTVCSVDQRGAFFEIRQREGDALITNTLGCALGVMTADCLPVVLYDQKCHAVAVVHAGWRGSVKGIVQKTIAKMGEQFGTEPGSVVAYFGPAARLCCYEVQESFCKNCDQALFFKRKDKIFFDNVRFNALQLLSCGVPEQSINLDHNICTICNPSYHSFRREGEKSGRQATIVMLKKQP